MVNVCCGANRDAVFAHHHLEQHDVSLATGRSSMSSGLIPLDDFEHAIASLGLGVSSTQALKATQQTARLSEERQRWVAKDRTRLEAQDTPQERQHSASGPSLPFEIVAQVAAVLSDAAEPSTGPAWLAALETPFVQDAHAVATRTPSMHAARSALLALSATCKAYRKLLAPVVWRSARFLHPRHFGELLKLMRNYRALASPLHRRASAGSVTDWDWNEGFPLRLVHELHVSMPQRYPGFAQELLVELLRNGMNSSLEHVVWEAEELPAGSTLRALIPASDWTSMQEEDLPEDKFGLGAEVGADEVVRWTRESRDGEAFPGVETAPVQSTHPLKRGITSLSIDCKCFWPGHAALQQLHTLRHVRCVNFDLFLLPPHLPALLQKLQQPLLTLSLSTSMTSIMHSLPLIHSGCFDQLHVLDLFPVTPEAPLPQAIRRCRRTLRVLRLNMDISANFANYDAFWRVLTGDYDDGPMEALEVLHVDPLPQQNTAPSFEEFLQRGSPRLVHINGKRKESFGPGVHDIDPDNITAALQY